MIFLMLGVLVFASLKFSEGEQYNFRLNTTNILDPEWVYAQHSVDTKIQCASLCFQDGESCFYFGYKNRECKLMTKLVNERVCSVDSCSNPGMKIYKLRREEMVTKAPEKETTTTDAPTIPTTTTTAVTTTTTTDAITTTTTTEPTTTSTTTEVDTTTTTTTEPTTTSTTTEAGSTTTTVTEPSTTSTTEAGTMTTTTTEPTTTTTEPTTTTTEPITTSTTTVTTTTTEATEEPFECKPPKAAEAKVDCATSFFLLRAMGSRSPFFKDVLSPACTDMKEQVYRDEEVVETFFSPNGGLSIMAQCPNSDDVVVEFKLCVKDYRIPVITLHCHPMKDKGRMKEIYNVTSDEMKHTLVDCGKNGAIQKMFFEDTGQAATTRVIFTCVMVEVKDDLPAGV